ncbi:diguanylate cyclase [Shewanella sp. GXUN23E]|uniref:sensor domain-containing diguanylate cyclase n=1 Tax=Shewanella sp. GXUN23E TaxID=3422498 RepID=UPI003D7EB4D7
MEKLTLGQLEEIVALLPDPAFILSRDGRYLAYLGGVDQDSYHDGSPLVGCSLKDVLPADKAQWFIEQIKLSLKNAQVKVVEYDLGVDEVQGVEPRGPVGMLHFEGKIVPLKSRFNGQRAVLWLTRNITRRYKLEQKLRTLSETDSLTGLYNRRFMQDTLKKYLKSHSRQRRIAALIFLDVDFFKRINDNYGHPVGDKVLCQLSERIERQLREEDVAARIGGEEFALLLPRTRLEEAVQVANRIRQAVGSEPVVVGELAISVTLSAGVTQLHEGDCVNSALCRADKALYAAKQTGRNRVCVA